MKQLKKCMLVFLLIATTLFANTVMVNAEIGDNIGGGSGGGSGTATDSRYTYDYNGLRKMDENFANLSECAIIKERENGGKRNAKTKLHGRGKD